MERGHKLGPPRPASTIDVSSCAREPIHTPGAIQPHGAFLAVLADGGLVTHASANLAAILGREADSVLGLPLGAAIGAVACRVLLRGGGRGPLKTRGLVHFLAGLDGRVLQLCAYPSGRHICIDIEPTRPLPSQRPAVIQAQSVLKTFQHAATRVELCELAVRGLKAISGYDRVMAYRFAEDGHGEVIAEAHRAGLKPFLGQHYPAEDIPPQARRQYLRQRVGAIADSAYLPVILLADPTLDDGAPLDLGHSALRSVSPRHCQYMRNMNTAASLTIGLAHGPDLWGMLVCHHMTPRIADPELRAVADMIGQVVSLLLGPVGQAEAEAQRLERTAGLQTLLEQLAAPVSLPEAVAAAHTELLDLVNATGAVVRISGALLFLGDTPAPAVAEHAFAVLQAEAGGDVLAVDDLGLRYPEFAGSAASASGALMLSITPDSGDGILWFRPEVSRTITWGGDPTKHATSDSLTGQLSPRASFAAWTETSRGRSAPWSAAELSLADELCRAVETQITLRAQTRLAQETAELAKVLNRNHMLLAAVDGLPSGIAVIGTRHSHWPLTYVNPAFLRMTGYEADEILERSVWFLTLLAADPEVVAEVERAVAASEATDVPFTLQRKDGTTFPCRLILRPIHDDAGQLTAYMGKITDLAFEAKCRNDEQRQKMEALGRMIGGVAHEINNMLQPVMLLGQDLIDRDLIADQGRKHLETILACGKSARDIIGDILAFSRPRPESSDVCDPVVLLDDALRLVRQALPADLTLTVRAEGRPPSVAVCATRFTQILLNLALNASGAMGGQGELTVVLDEISCRPHEIDGPQTRFARLRVIDTGCGMDKATLERAFEPFFTTKIVGDGTGLGLSVVYGLVQELGGTIAFESEPGRGTTATILLPACNGEMADGLHIGDRGYSSGPTVRAHRLGRRRTPGDRGGERDPGD